MSNFRPINRDMDFLMPPSVDEWLPQRHLARFVAEVIEGLDLRAMTGSYRGSGEASQSKSGSSLFILGPHGPKAAVRVGSDASSSFLPL